MRFLPNITDMIARAKKAIQDLKNPQFAGTHNVVVREITTADTWDIDETVVLTVPSPSKVFFFTFTADRQKAPVVSFKPRILVNGVEDSLSSSLMYEELNQYVNLQDLDNDTLQRTSGVSYLIFSGTPTSPVVKIKMRVLANDSGTIGVSSVQF